MVPTSTPCVMEAAFVRVWMSMMDSFRRGVHYEPCVLREENLKPVLGACRFEVSGEAFALDADRFRLLVLVVHVLGEVFVELPLGAQGLDGFAVFGNLLDGRVQSNSNTNGGDGVHDGSPCCWGLIIRPV